jgi:cytochrome c-type biogenesis protein CcmH/NrfG
MSLEGMQVWNSACSSAFGVTDERMADEGKKPATGNAAWHPAQVYIMAGICLVVGVIVGYLVRGSAPPAVTAAPESQPAASASASAAPHAMPSLDDMKRMADAQVQPLLEKLQNDPNNSDLLNQVGNIYRVTHQFKTAETYYQKALAANPKNVGARTDLASCMYYEGDVDGAIAQLEKSLTYDPKHAGTLFNLGMIRWKGKHDAKGAIATWQKLLKLHPDYENKDAVEKLIAEAQAHGGNTFPSTE